MAQINVINQLNMNHVKVSATKKSGESSTCFSDIMSENTKEAQDREKSNNVSDRNVNSTQFDESKSNLKKLEKLDEASKNEVKEVGESVDINVTDEMQKEAEETVHALKEVIASTLGISKEKLDEMMVELGMTAMDLLQVNSLKELVLQVNNMADASELLTNEGVCNQLAELLQTVDEFVQSTDMEQFAKVVMSMQTQDFAVTLKNQNTDLKVDANDVNIEETADADTMKDASEEPIITIQREVTSENEENSSRNGTKEEQKNLDSQFNQFIQNLSDSVQDVDNVSTSNFDRLQQMQEIVDQVVESIKVTLSVDSTSMELQLNPEHLGKINVSVLSKNGLMTANFTVENHLAKEALESQLSVLKENLTDQGMKVDAIEVTVAEHGFSQNEFSNQGQNSFQNQTKRGNHTGKIRSEHDLTEESEEEVVSIMQGNGTVDFSA